MVAGILHGNDLRDIGYDNSAGISTLLALDSRVDHFTRRSTWGPI